MRVSIVFEARGTSGKAGASVADMGERPNLVKVATDFRVEVIGDHSPGGGALFAEMGNKLVTGNGFHSAAFQVVIAAFAVDRVCARSKHG